MYNPEGGFSQYLYTKDGESITASNGVTGNVIKKIEGTAFDGLPVMSNTSEVYLKKDGEGNIIQARIFSNRQPVCDFDWNHEHKNTRTKEIFPQGIVHVQEWKQNQKGEWKREKYKARYMNLQEIARYGELIKLANPNAILSP